MSLPNTIEVCKANLFTKEDELRNLYPQTLVDKVLRVREMYNWFISNPDGTDREFVAELLQRHAVSKVTAYSDLVIVKSLLPMLGIEPIPNIADKISAMIEKYRKETIDIEDVEFEEYERRRSGASSKRPVCEERLLPCALRRRVVRMRL